LYRSKKTGNSRGFAFLEFEDEEVAKIAAAAMNSYLLYGHILKVHVVDKKKKFIVTFGSAAIKYTNPSIGETRECAIKTKKNQKKKIKNKKNIFWLKNKKKRNKLKELGIDYEFPGYAACATDSDKPKDNK